MNERTLCFLVRGNPASEVLSGLKKTGFGVGKYAGFGGRAEIGETIEKAAVRELEEETGIKVSTNDLHPIGHLTFLFPSNPHWSQSVHVFLVEMWLGNPQENDEMKPIWSMINEIPFESVWDDASDWLPLPLKGESTRASFVYRDDNETVGEAKIEDWEEGRPRW